MLEIHLGEEMWDPVKEEFTYRNDTLLRLEHSLYSMSQWESKYHKPFLVTSKEEKRTIQETIDYIKFMMVDKLEFDVAPLLNNEILEKVNEYIKDPYCATTITRNGPKNHSKEIVTAELIYYWMVALQIPFECQYWHLNKLMTLIEVCSIKNTPSDKRKMNRKDQMAMQRRDMAKRRAEAKARAQGKIK